MEKFQCLTTYFIPIQIEQNVTQVLHPFADALRSEKVLRDTWEGSPQLPKSAGSEGAKVSL